MPATRLWSICSLLLLCVGCASEKVVGAAETFAHSAASSQCGPADGPAVSIYLAPSPVHSLEPPLPYVRIDVWQPLERLADGPWELSGPEAEAHAVYFGSGADPELATSGRLMVSAVAAQNTIIGSVDVRFPAVGRITRAFEATWLPRAALCG